MSNRTLDVGSLLERLVTDRRVQIGGGLLGALVVGVSLAAGSMDVKVKSKRTAAVLTAPEVSPNLPLIRSWPYPRPMVEEARADALRRGPMTAAARYARR